MDENNIPLEVAIAEVKTSIARYANDLCRRYEMHPAILLQILQEIIYENRLNTVNQILTQMRLDAQSNNQPIQETPMENPPMENPVDIPSE